MRIGVLNPNTTRAMTESIGSCARAVTLAEIVAVNPATGPASIESHIDEALAVPGVLEVLGQDELLPADDRMDGWVLACFGDPGLDAARELASGPVVGIAEAAMHAATLVGRGFAVVTTLSRTEGRASDLVHHYGFARQCVSIASVGVSVLDLEDPRSDARARLVAACGRAVEHDGADSIVLGCAGMADFCASVSREIGVPVIDGVTAGVKLIESLVALGLSTSRRNEFSRPPAKNYTGVMQRFAPHAAELPSSALMG